MNAIHCSTLSSAPLFTPPPPLFTHMCGALCSHMCASGHWRIKPLAPAVCKVTYCGQAEVGGKIPRAILNTQIRSTLTGLNLTVDKFERKNIEVDAEMRGSFPTPPLLSLLAEDQISIINSCQALESSSSPSSSSSSWERLKSPSPFVVMYMQHATPLKGTRSAALGLAKADVDCGAREALAWYFQYCSRLRSKGSLEDGDPARLIVRERVPHDVVFTTIKKMPFPLFNREFVDREICATDNNGDFILACEPTDDGVDYGSSMITVRGLSQAFLRFSPIAASHGGQTHVAFYQYLDVGGVVPVSIVNKNIPSALAGLIRLRVVFQRDEEIDSTERSSLAAIFDKEQSYSEEENKHLKYVTSKIGTRQWEDFEELESFDDYVRMGKIYINGESSGVGRASTVVDASVGECAAWENAKYSREKAAIKHQAGRGESTLSERNGHTSIYRTVINFDIPGLKPREFVQVRATHTHTHTPGPHVISPLF